MYLVTFHHCVCVCVLSVNAVSAAVSGLSCLYQQSWSRRAAVTVVTISTFITWREITGKKEERNKECNHVLKTQCSIEISVTCHILSAGGGSG